MPVITMESAKLTKEQKQALVQEFTSTASRVTGISKEDFYVFIRENDFDNVGIGGIGGQLLSAKK